MLGLEVSSTMRTFARRSARIARPGEGEWLHRLLVDINQEVAGQPRPEAIKRIRTHLLEAIKRPVKAAA
jgi:hypothetical protein